MSRRSSGRIRTLNQKARTSLAKESTENGESTATFERNARLEALENDGVHYIDTQETDPEEEVFSKKKGKKKRKTGFNKKRVPSLNYVLEQEFYESYAKNVPTYLTSRSSPSQYPPRHFCSVCGFTAPYTCIRCGLRMCSSRCTTVHWETLRSTHY